MTSASSSSARVARVALIACVLAYSGCVLLATLWPKPQFWGVHLAAFLPPPERWVVLSLILCGSALVLLSGPGESLGREERSSSRLRVPAWLLLIPCAALMWVFRARTPLLGDGTLWLRGLQEGDAAPATEPLAGTLWLWSAGWLRNAGVSIDEPTIALFSVLCGIIAVALAWGLAREFAPTNQAAVWVLALLLTLGVSQLYFGYLESYPPVAVVILAYLYVGIRRLRGAAPILLPALLLALAIASHLLALYLLPSFVYLTWRERISPYRRTGLIVLGLGLGAALLLMLGSSPSDWAHPFGIAARALHAGSSVGNASRPYPLLSGAHALDLANALLLVVPVPLMVLVTMAVSRPDTRELPVPTTVFLALAGAGGLLAALVLVLPLSAAQDWDLTSLLLLPLGVLGIYLAQSVPGARRNRRLSVGLVVMGLGSLSAFVLVNANEASATRRFAAILGPEARVTPYARAYGFEMLARYYRDKGDPATALQYARRMIQAEPSNPRHWAKVGTALFNLGRYAEAIPFLETAIHSDPERVGTRTNLGISYAATGRSEDAIAQFRAAISLDGNRPDLRHNLALALTQAGRVDSARVVWNDLLARWPGYEPAARAARMHLAPPSGSR